MRVFVQRRRRWKVGLAVRALLLIRLWLSDVPFANRNDRRHDLFHALGTQSAAGLSVTGGPRPLSQGLLDRSVVQSWAAQLASGLAFLHSHFALHGDLSGEERVRVSRLQTLDLRGWQVRRDAD